MCLLCSPVRRVGCDQSRWPQCVAGSKDGGVGGGRPPAVISQPRQTQPSQLHCVMQGALVQFSMARGCGDNGGVGERVQVTAVVARGTHWRWQHGSGGNLVSTRETAAPPLPATYHRMKSSIRACRSGAAAAADGADQHTATLASSAARAQRIGES
jgi:hypothetical protein